MTANIIIYLMIIAAIYYSEYDDKAKLYFIYPIVCLYSIIELAMNSCGTYHRRTQLFFRICCLIHDFFLASYIVMHYPHLGKLIQATGGGFFLTFLSSTGKVLTQLILNPSKSLNIGLCSFFKQFILMISFKRLFHTKIRSYS